MKFIGAESGQALKIILSNELKGYLVKYEVVKATQDLTNLSQSSNLEPLVFIGIIGEGIP